MGDAEDAEVRGLRGIQERGCRCAPPPVLTPGAEPAPPPLSPLAPRNRPCHPCPAGNTHPGSLCLCRDASSFLPRFQEREKKIFCNSGWKNKNTFCLLPPNHYRRLKWSKKHKNRNGGGQEGLRDTEREEDPQRWRGGLENLPLLLSPSLPAARRGRLEGRVDGRTDGRMDGRTDGGSHVTPGLSLTLN